jgi:hypothetical protein
MYFFNEAKPISWVKGAKLPLIDLRELPFFNRLLNLKW